MRTLDFVSGLHNCLEFSQPLSCLYQAMQNTEDVFYCLRAAVCKYREFASQNGNFEILHIQSEKTLW